MIKRLSFCLIIIILFAQNIIATEFDELDKPPEGAHEGQIFLGAFFTLGWPYSDLIDAENDFLKGSTYTFENDITKALEVSHQSFAIGISFEYMPVNHFGAALRLRRTYLVQNTAFGPDYENWKGYLYRDFSIFISPTLHATTRRTWDFVLIPLLGYSFSKYNATPIAKKTIQNYSGDTKRESKGLSYGSELNCTIYFTGGLYISIGGEWIRNHLDLGEDFNLTNPQTGNNYKANTSATIDTYSIIIGAGYAFSN